MTRIDFDKKFFGEGFTYDDVLLVPRHSTFRRKEVSLETQITPNITLKLPVVSSPMDTVTEADMVVAMAQSGGIGIIHRNIEVSRQVELIESAKNAEVADPDTATLDSSGRLAVGVAVGAGADLEERVPAIVSAGADLICVDSGHGHSDYILDAVREIRKNYPDIGLMAGNVATADGAKALVEAGVDSVRVGVGPGSICTTRIISGMGVPQLTAVMEAVKGVGDAPVSVIADGGIKQIGDMAKALCAGADVVMLGGLLAGYDESPGEVIEHEGKKYKSYRGMGSLGAMVKGGAERYGQNPDELKEKLIPEGVEGLKEYKGEVGTYLYQIAGSLRSSLYYMGSKSLKEFHENAQFIQITPASMAESHPHHINITNTGKNYGAK